MNVIRRNKFRRLNSRSYSYEIFFNHFFRVFRGLFAKHGAKKRAQKFFFVILYYFYLEFGFKDPIRVFYHIFEFERPRVALVAKRIGSSLIKIPSPISSYKSFSLVFQFFKRAVHLRSEFTIIDKIFSELRSVYLTNSSAIRKKKLEIHRLAYLNYSYIRRKSR